MMKPREPDKPPLDIKRPFLRANFRQAGRSTTILRRRIYKQVMRSVWIHRGGIDDDTMIRAALALHPPGAWASRVSAARVHRLPVPEHPFEHVTVADPADRRARPQIKSHVTTRRRHLVVVRGIPVTDVIGTFIECAGMLGLVDLVILGDAICRRGAVTADQLRRACDKSTDYYAGLARVAAAYVRDGVDSPMETRLRMLIVLAGLPEPDVNHKVYNDDGTWRRRFDLCYSRIKLIIEYDGRQHADSAEQWESDLERREEFDDDGYRIIVVTAKGIYRNPQETINRIHRQLVLRGWGDVPVPTDHWKEYFSD